MSNRHGAARRAKQHFRTELRLQDLAIDGVSDDEAAIEAQDWHEDHVPAYEASAPNHHLEEKTLPF